MKERREQRRKKEESHTIKQTKFHNNLNGLEKYSLTFGEQPQWLRKIYICNNLNGLEKHVLFIHFFHSPSSYTVLCSCSCTVATLSWVSRDNSEGGKGERDRSACEPSTHFPLRESSSSGRCVTLCSGGRI